MECYFGSQALPSDNQIGKNSVVMFHIPDIGIRFKAPFEAVDRDHCDLASFLALMEFIDSNQKYFSNNTYRIFGNNQTVIDQLNHRQVAPEILTHLFEKAGKYRDKYRYSLEWIPSWDNTATDLF